MISRANTALLLAGALAPLAGCEPSREELIEQHQATVTRYCTSCHDDVERTAELSLKSLPVADLARHPAVWETVVRKLRAGRCRPSASLARRPNPRGGRASSRAARRARRREPESGPYRSLHRLNRAEYRNAVRDLLALDVDVADAPARRRGELRLRQHRGRAEALPDAARTLLLAAAKVTRPALAIAAAAGRIDGSDVARRPAAGEAPARTSRSDRAAASRYGTTFPLDAEYVLPPSSANERRVGEEQALESPSTASSWSCASVGTREHVCAGSRSAASVAENGGRIAPIGCPSPSAPVHTVTATFLARTAALDEPARSRFERPYPAGVNIPETRTGSYLRAVEISGPYEPTGAGETASRDRIFVPSAGRRRGGGSRSLRKRDLERARAARVSTARDRRRRRAAARVLPRRRRARLRRGSPARAEALARLARVPVPRRAGPGRRVAGLRLRNIGSHAGVAPLLLPVEQHPRRRTARGRASAAAARSARCSSGRCGACSRIRARRRSSRTSPASGSICATWTPSCPTPSVFPDFDDTLRQALRRETELFFDSIVREDRSVARLAATPTTRSSTSGSRGTTAYRTSRAATSAASRCRPTARAAACSATAAS